MQRISIALAFTLVFASAALADNPAESASWSDLVQDGESLVFGRFVGKFESPEFSSRRVRLRDHESGKEILLAIDDGVGYIAELVPPGTYSVDLRMSADGTVTVLAGALTVVWIPFGPSGGIPVP